jgi:hypothetical protein
MSWLTRIIDQLCSPWGRTEVEPDGEDDSVRTTEVRTARRQIGVAAALHQAELFGRRQR